MARGVDETDAVRWVFKELASSFLGLENPHLGTCMLCCQKPLSGNSPPDAPPADRLFINA